MLKARRCFLTRRQRVYVSLGVFLLLLFPALPRCHGEHQLNPVIAKATEREQLLERENFDAALEAANEHRKWPDAAASLFNRSENMVQAGAERAAATCKVVMLAMSALTRPHVRSIACVVLQRPDGRSHRLSNVQYLEYAGTSSAAQTRQLKITFAPQKSRPLHL